MDGHDSENAKQTTADMTAFVQNLLEQMQGRFQTMSDSIIHKIDEMGNRIDELEQSINDLRTEMGVEGSPSPSVPIKEEPKTDEGYSASNTHLNPAPCHASSPIAYAGNADHTET